MPIVLGQDNFFDNVLDRETDKVIGEKPWFIEFFAPWCPHCQHLAPVWDSLHRESKDEVNIARVDCTGEAGRPLCKHFSVHGYPTLLFFPLDKASQLTYEGKRTLEAMESWI